MSAMTKSLEWYLEQQRSLGGALKRLGAAVAANRKLAIGLALGILTAVGGIFGYRAWGQRHEEKSADLLYKAVSQLATRGSADQAKQQEEAVRLLRDIMDRYPRTAAAAEATLRLGNLFYAQENYDGARKTFEAYLASNPRGRIAFSAALGIADTYQAQQKYETAAQAYLRLISEFPREPLLPEAYLNLARAYVAMGKPRDAARLYDQVSRTYPNTGWARDAQARLRKLSLPR